MSNIVNAKITSTFLGIEDHGIFTAIITVDKADGTTQDLRYKDYGEKYLRKILEVVEVESWEQLKGKYVRVDCQGTIRGIGNIIKDKWFYP